MLPFRPMVGAASVALILSACDSLGAGGPGQPTPAASASVAGGVTMQDVAPVLSTARREAGLPLTLYVGADYCPFCASMRWPLVTALSRFGSFAGLDHRESTGGVDGFPSLATYDFNHATYASPYVTFQSVETADANGNPLQQPSAAQASLINQFDPGGGIPFVFVAGRFVAGLPYSPSLLHGRSFEQIQADIDSPNPDQLGQAINHEADVITALICSGDNMQPAAVCGTSQIQQLAKAVPS